MALCKNDKYDANSQDLQFIALTLAYKFGMESVVDF